MSTSFSISAKTVNRDLLVLMLLGALCLGLSALLTPLFGLPNEPLRPLDLGVETNVYGPPALVFDWPIDRDDIDERRSARVLAVVLAAGVARHVRGPAISRALRQRGLCCRIDLLEAFSGFV